MIYPHSIFIEVFHTDDGILKMFLNRPKKKNALNYDMTSKFSKILHAAATDSSIKVVAVSGRGDYFTSGNDFSHQDKELEGLPLDEAAKLRSKAFNDLFTCLIDFPKPLLAILNGPAVGVGVTMLGHFDYVIASDLASFHTPFTKLAITAEGCSSYIFPRLMGLTKATDMLTFGKKIDAKEALDSNLIGEIVPHEKLVSAWDKIHLIASFPLEVMVASKRLLKPKEYRNILYKVHHAETDELKIRTQSDEFRDTLLRFKPKSSKL